MYHIRRIGRDFSKTSTLRNLYITLVRPILEYGIQIWFTYQDFQIQKLELIQAKFVKFIVYQQRSKGVLTSVQEQCRSLDPWKLKDRYTYLQLCFFFKVMNNLIVSPEILQMINFKIPKAGL